MLRTTVSYPISGCYFQIEMISLVCIVCRLLSSCLSRQYKKARSMPCYIVALWLRTPAESRDVMLLSIANVTEIDKIDKICDKIDNLCHIWQKHGYIDNYLRPRLKPKAQVKAKPQPGSLRPWLWSPSSSSLTKPANWPANCFPDSKNPNHFNRITIYNIDIIILIGHSAVLCQIWKKRNEFKGTRG